MESLDVMQRVEDLVRPLTDSLGLELVELEYKREGRHMVLRLYIDKEGGITLDDCAAVSKEVSAVLDVEDIVADRYTLEVSSPGLNRPLKSRADYDRHIGRLVKIKTLELIADDAGNRRKTFLGELLGLDGDLIRVKLREGQTAAIPLGDVAKANLEFEM
ncbi:MAG: ribosome maturation factor RimP [Deltaproteobacteria bacterium]|nr:ribosome maturation factor RimP [Deltaproteobacteria bacterium]